MESGRRDGARIRPVGIYNLGYRAPDASLAEARLEMSSRIASRIRRRAGHNATPTEERGQTMLRLLKWLEPFFNDPSYRWLKVPATAIVVGVLFLTSMVRSVVDNPAKPGWSPDKLPMVLGVGLVGALLGAALGTALVLKDITTARRTAGKPVNWFLKLCFANGIVSLLMWSVVAVAAILTGVVIFAPL
jgi:hypothetical protein